MQTETDDDGIVVRMADGRGVVIENRNGILIVNVWSDPKSVGNDPTHEIEIE